MTTKKIDLSTGLRYSTKNGYIIDKRWKGERIYETLGMISHKAAVVELEKRMAKLESGDYVPTHVSRGITVRDVLNRYWSEKLIHCESETTNPSRRYYLTAIDRILGSRVVANLKKRDIEEYKRVRSAERVRRVRQGKVVEYDLIKPRTVQAELAELSMAITHMVDNELLPINGVKRFCRYKVPRRKKILLDHGREFGEQFVRIYKKLPAAWRLFFLTSYATGMRPSEITRLRWEWIEQPFPGYYMVNYPSALEKTEHCDRRIPLAPWLVKRLLRGSLSSGLVFKSTETNSRIVEYRHPWTLARAAANIPREYTPYCLRRTRATIWDQIDSTAARVALGHVPKDVHEESYVVVPNERLFRLVGANIASKTAANLFHDAVQK